jgi:hypothetical protein
MVATDPMFRGGCQRDQVRDRIEAQSAREMNHERRQRQADDVVDEERG